MKKLDKSLRKFNKSKEDKLIPISGTLGIPINGQKVVEVPNREGFVFVKIDDNLSEVIQAYNSEVSTSYGLPVQVAWRVNRYVVIGRNLDIYTNNWGNIPYLPKHGGQHSFNPVLSMGADITWVYQQQIMMMLGYPSGTAGSPRLTVAPYLIQDLSGNWKYVGNTGTPNTTLYNPTTGSRALMALVYVDTVSGNPYLLVNSGTYFSDSLTGTNEIAPYIPRLTDPNHIPVAAIRLVSGTSSLTWNNIYDARPFLRVIPSGSSGGGSSSLTIWDEGVLKGVATILDVVGINADISVSGTVARLFITGSTGGGGTVNPPITGSIVIQDDYVVQGSALSLNFGQNITASMTGTTANIDAIPGYTDDLTGYINGTGTSFPLSLAPQPATVHLYYNGVRQRYTIHYLISGSYIQTLFTPVTGSALIADYNQFGNQAAAPPDEKYVTTSPSTYLTNEVAIPGLAGNADRYGVGGVGVSYEFDSGISPLTWSIAVDVENVNSTIKSSLYINDNDSSAKFGTYSWSPAGAFDIRCKFAMGAELGTSASSPMAGLAVMDTALTGGIVLAMRYDGTADQVQLRAFTSAAGTFTQRGVSQVVGGNSIYLRLVRDGSNNTSFYWSSDGNVWNLIVTQSLTFTAAKAGLWVQPASIVCNLAVDWIRSDV